MKVIDLTHTIEEDMSIFPGVPGPKLEMSHNYREHGFRQTYLQMYTHSGTHMDPPAHMYEEGTTLDQFPPEQFIGKAIVIDCRHLREGEDITMKELTPQREKIEGADFLLFNLGWDKFWKTEKYFGNYPCLDDEVLDFIMKGSFKGIGFDVIGLDPINDGQFTRHYKLFKENEIINIENLANLDQCGEELFHFSCFPLKLKNSDGAPIRAIAWFEE